MSKFPLISLFLFICLNSSHGEVFSGIKFKDNYDTVYSFKQHKISLMPDKSFNEQMGLQLYMRPSTEPYEFIVTLKEFTIKEPIYELSYHEMVQLLTPYKIRLQENGVLKTLVTGRNESLASKSIKHTAIRTVFSDILEYKSFMNNPLKLANFSSNWDFIKLAIVNCNSSVAQTSQGEELGFSFSSEATDCQKGFFELPEDFWPTGNFNLVSTFSKHDFSLLERYENSTAKTQLATDTAEMKYQYRLKFSGFKEQERVNLEKIDEEHEAHALPEFQFYLANVVQALFDKIFNSVG